MFIKGYQAVESSRAVDTVVLEKSGTVTSGQMTLTAVLTVPGRSRAELLALGATVEHASEYPVASAFSMAACPDGRTVQEVDELVALPGLGAKGLVAGCEVLSGRENAVRRARSGRARRHHPVVRGPGTRRRTTVLVSWDGAVRDALAAADTVTRRPPRRSRNCVGSGCGHHRR